jgi:hypothetical protein
MPLSKPAIHGILSQSLGSAIEPRSPSDAVPLRFLFKRFDLVCHAYAFTITRQIRGRPQDEYRIQVIVPGSQRGSRLCLDSDDGAFPLLIGYSPDFDVLALWDATLYKDFAYSRNLQVRELTLLRALAETVSSQDRYLRQDGRRLQEIILASRREHFADALSLRLTGGRP